MPADATEAECIDAFATQTAAALAHVSVAFPGMSLHDRVAILAPSTAFCDRLRAPLIARSNPSLQLEQETKLRGSSSCLLR